MLYNLDKIKKAFELYYKSLYSQRTQVNNDSIKTFLDSLDLPSIGQKQNNLLVKEITQEELDKALNNLKNNKMPGNDGLPSEWFKTFRREISPLLISSFNWTLKEAATPPSWREAIISIIPKEGKDKTLCSSYRPVSVLNVDYKLFASILAKRLETFLPDLIDSDQTGFIRGRQTFDNIRRTLHIIQQIKKDHIKATLVSLDAEKAFDYVNWLYLFQVLLRFGFSENSVRSFQSLYFKPEARIKTNGGLTKKINLERGTRQGCPLSPLLFAIYIEPLAQAIRENNIIEGITVNKVEHKMALYADDMLVYLSNPDISLPKLFDFLEEYGRFSGYKLNIKKTQMLSFGFNPIKELRQRLNINWNQKANKYLGVWLTQDLTKLYKKNYNIINGKIKEDLKRWSSLPHLDFSSRIESIKMNVLPRLLYLFQSLPVEIPPEQFQGWDKQISRLIWNGNKPRTRYKTLQLEKNKGGMSLPNLKDYYYAAQLRPLVCWCDLQIETKWKEIESEFQGVPVQALIGKKSHFQRQIQYINPITQFTLKIWFKIVKEFHLEKQIQILNWVAYNPDFKPGTIDHRFTQWIYLGISALCTITNNGNIESFQALKDKFGLVNHDLFRYLQVRQYYMKEIKNNDEINQIVQVVIQAYKKGTSEIVSKLYKGISNLRNHSIEYLRLKWEKEVGISLLPEQWYKICTIPHTSTSSRMWREFCWKNLTRFFITPRIKELQTRTSYPCWRKCGVEKAHHTHIFWHCSKVHSFWEVVQSTINSIFTLHISKSFYVLYFGDIPDEVGKDDKYLFKILLATSKKAITRKWYKEDPPTREDWFQIVTEVREMERLTYTLRLQTQIFENQWRKWLTCSFVV